MVTTKIQCSYVSGEPKPTMKWTNSKGTVLYECHHTSPTCTLILANPIFEKDHDRFTCTASSLGGTYRQSVSVSILGKNSFYITISNNCRLCIWLCLEHLCYTWPFLKTFDMFSSWLQQDLICTTWSTYENKAIGLGMFSLVFYDFDIDKNIKSSGFDVYFLLL